jgi:hypothetical protein
MHTAVPWQVAPEAMSQSLPSVVAVAHTAYVPAETVTCLQSDAAQPPPSPSHAT